MLDGEAQTLADGTEDPSGSGTKRTAPAAPPIFRQSALERFASPEQLDRMVAVTLPRAWIGLLTVWILLIALVVWGVWGSIPVRVHGSGMLLDRGSHLYPVVPASAGRVTELAVEKGEAVERGQLVAALTPHQGATVRLESPVKGRVTEVLVRVGDIVEPAVTLLAIASEGEGTEALVYLPPHQFGQIEVGMPAQVTPFTVDPNEYGSIRGTVVAVHSFPSSEAEIAAALQDETLAATLVTDGPPTGVRIELARNADGSGFQWSTSNGPPFAISSGALADAGITVREEPPIVLVIPAFKRLFGL